MDLPESCVGCGKCCYPFVPVIPQDTTTPAEWVEERQQGPKTFRVLRQLPDANPAYRDAGYEHCLHLEPVTKLCLIYDDPRRPSICRDFTRGEPLCLKMLEEFQAAAADLGPL